MHPAIEHQPLTGGLQVVTIGANLSAPREIDELQFFLFLLLLLLLSTKQARIILLNTRTQVIDQTHEHRNDLQQLFFAGLNHGLTE